METEAVNANERAAGRRCPARGWSRWPSPISSVSPGSARRCRRSKFERLANRLAEAAREVAAKPVRFIKTIGDAVMLVSAEAAPLLEAMLALVETIDSDEAPPQLRAGCPSGRR